MHHFVGKHQCPVKHQVVGKHESVGKYESVGMHEDAGMLGYVAVHEYVAMLLQVSQQQAWAGCICISAQPHKRCTACLCAAAAVCVTLETVQSTCNRVAMLRVFFTEQSRRTMQVR